MKNRQFWTLLAVVLVIGLIALYNISIISDRTLFISQNVVDLGRDVYQIKDVLDNTQMEVVRLRNGY